MKTNNSNSNNIKEILSNYKALGYDTVSISEILYYVRGIKYVIDVIKVVQSLGYSTKTINGEMFVIIKPKLQSYILPAVKKYNKLVGDTHRFE